MTELRKTPLHSRHVAAGARMVEFAGWHMPVQYTGVIDEHLAVRERAGVFDVSHMGEVFFEGEGAAEAVDRLVTNHVAALADGQASYSGLLNEQGCFVDDVLSYKFSPNKVLVVVNAANREKDVAHLKAHHTGPVELRDESDQWAQLAVQGPEAPALVQKLTDTDLSTVERYHFTEGRVAGVPCIIARTGYTGEDGFELYCANEGAGRLWDAVVEAGAVPCGLGARDTLRLEYKMALYGNDIDDAHTPLEAGLGWAVKWDKGDFVGRDALAKQKEAGVTRKLVAFKLLDRGIPRPHMKIRDADGTELGEVTSGTMSPSLKEPIGIAWVPAGLAKFGTQLHIDVRGRLAAAEVVKPPFVKKA